MASASLSPAPFSHSKKLSTAESSRKATTSMLSENLVKDGEDIKVIHGSIVKCMKRETS